MPVASSQVRFKGNVYDVCAAIRTGHTSIVYKTTAGPVIKQYRAGKSPSQLEREVFWLDRLKGTAAAPDLLDVDRSCRAVMMSDCGQPISPLNAPDDWDTQLAALMDQLRANGCAHNDISEEEVLVKDGKLRIVDFAFALERSSDGAFANKLLASNSNKKVRYFLDDHIDNCA
jgi:predicted Ser/Thr protein kinase